MTKHEKLTDEKIMHIKKRLQELKNENEEKLESNKGTNPNDETQELADHANHPGDLGTEQFEQERDAGLDLVREDRLQDINDALERIANGTYGLSEKSGKPIPIERLEAQPAARNLVEEEE
ncbi:RNA polymerase-binding transcription factor DksA [Virgibacillus natechei]|uniref:RNA polymerase-binding transcription factor DksA n=1 Tax=Virgibacillus natechei TaxID=1216297 RepID=A0ABS4IF31_9BACI|nr:hypothetical protein [Virgibacillus natechei]MBP1969550.1 RNA polymerase-binding transcription factor DksA [Virgibacillus natechei]UZD11751.1 hypothetical protein OLD84_12425 [Virgibacillus natechei]